MVEGFESNTTTHRMNASVEENVVCKGYIANRRRVVTIAHKDTAPSYVSAVPPVFRGLHSSANYAFVVVAAFRSDHLYAPTVRVQAALDYCNIHLDDITLDNRLHTQ